MEAEYASCCILSYNRVEFLAEMIGTLMLGQYPMEIIVHDDGSSDERVRQYLYHAVKEGMVSTVIENPPEHNQGQGVALNRMFGMASGDPILKLDQDLIFKPGWLANCVRVLDANRENVVQPQIGLMGLFRYPAEPVDFRKTKLADFEGGWESHTHICGSAFAMPRAAWEHFGPFSEHSEAFAEDWEMQKKVTAEGGWCCALPPDDLCSNQGFGVGPSTVVVDHGQVAEINKGPLVVRGDQFVGGRA
jgi:glycosyltransferase involved in cell wall biosynthesis